jgi:hypothetical protein
VAVNELVQNEPASAVGKRPKQRGVAIHDAE